jgi:signal peptidase I
METDEHQPDPVLQSEWPTQPAGPPPPKPHPLSFIHKFPVLIVIAFALALLIKTFLLQAFYIPSGSMVPTLLVKDRVLVNKLVYQFRDPKRGEVIVFIAQKGTKKSFFGRIRSFLTEGLGVTLPPEKDFIKRVIGLPGDAIEVSEKGTFITPPHGKRFRLVEPYINRTTDEDSTTMCGTAKDCPLGPTQPRFVVPKGEYFVMGDNRADSMDSRSSLGTIDRGDIVGKAFVRIWPLRREGILHVPSYPVRSGRAAASFPAGAVLLLGIATFRRQRL